MDSSAFGAEAAEESGGRYRYWSLSRSVLIFPLCLFYFIKLCWFLRKHRKVKENGNNGALLLSICCQIVENLP
jgi:hypothetical protein